jgi:AhpD family alkylhydroperoxidase
MTTPRLAFWELSPELLKSYTELNHTLENSSLGKPLVELINLRISLINGCSYCLGMHSQSLRVGGETNARIDQLAGWKVSSQYTEKERSALAWTDAVTNISTSGTPDDLFEALKAHFSDKEISDITFAIITMNALNRLGISMRK